MYKQSVEKKTLPPSKVKRTAAQDGALPSSLSPADLQVRSPLPNHGRKQALPADLFFPENIFMINLTP